MKRRTPPKKPEWEVVFDLEQIDPNITGADLIELASRAKVYNSVQSRSGLSDAGWCKAMAISEERHKAYKQMSIIVPNSLLNKAVQVQRRVLALITRLHNEGV